MPFKIISLKLYFLSEKSCKCSFYLFLFPRLMKLIWNIYSLSNIQFQELRNNAACLFTVQTSILRFIASFVQVTCKTLIQIFHPFFFFFFFLSPLYVVHQLSFSSWIQLQFHQKCQISFPDQFCSLNLQRIYPLKKFII